MIALVKNLTSKEPFYVRCIKPNDQKSPVLFDEERVRHQVISTVNSETLFNILIYSVVLCFYRSVIWG
jgi:hypothetical protein